MVAFFIKSHLYYSKAPEMSLYTKATLSKKDMMLCVLIVAGSAIAAAVSYIAQGTRYIKIDTPGAELRLSSGWFGKTAVISGITPMAVLPRTYHPACLCVKKNHGTDVATRKGTRPISIGLSLTGQAGEAYALNTITKNSRPIKDLAIHIVDSNGVIVSRAIWSMAEAASAGTRGECLKTSKANIGSR